jgi:hypothetical protein
MIDVAGSLSLSLSRSLLYHVHELCAPARGSAEVGSSALVPR